VRSEPSVEVFVSGERLPLTPETMYLVAEGMTGGREFAAEASLGIGSRSPELEPIRAVLDAARPISAYDDTVRWLVTPNVKFEGLRPIEMIIAGNPGRVLRFLESARPADMHP
jgi:hypothetical protein